eukprot:scaffold5064_cov137-Skeletonema_menzelii.AAC.1
MMKVTEATEQICASCGIKGDDDDVKLKHCTACYLVKYCGVECQRKHRGQHKRACKKRAAELKDELLFKQPDSTHLGDCLICLLPIPFPTIQDTLVRSTLYQCCGKLVCNGCVYANMLREIEGGLRNKCPFCRHKFPHTVAEVDQSLMKRAEANDPFALMSVGGLRFRSGDYATAIEYWEKAASLGDIESHFHLSCMYEEERGVEKDTRKYIHHAEQAAIEGSEAYHIAANLGDDKAIQALKVFYAGGLVSKDDFAAALRAHQAAVDAMKSPQPQRDAAELNRKM